MIRTRILAAVVLLGVPLLASCSPSHPDQGQQTGTKPSQIAPGSALLKIGIDGGYGHLTSLELNRDGSGLWHGWAPGRRVASQLELKLGKDDVERIWALAGRVDVMSLADEYRAGRQSRNCTLIFTFQDGEKPIRIRAGDEDARPQALKDLFDALWRTQNQTVAPREPESDQIRRFGQVKEGMTWQQVTALLGEPGQRIGDRRDYWAYEGPYRTHILSVWVADGVVTKTELMGEWERPSEYDIQRAKALRSR